MIRKRTPDLNLKCSTGYDSWHESILSDRILLIGVIRRSLTPISIGHKTKNVGREL